MLIKKISFYSLALILFISSIFSAALRAHVSFANKGSRITVSSDTRFNISSAGLTVDGTIIHASGGLIEGTPISFSKGLLDYNGGQVEATAGYTGAVHTTLTLDGNKTLNGLDLFTPDSLSVTGINNTIKGEIAFSEELTLGSNANLTLGIETGLTKDLTLSGGTLTLGSDLRCLSQIAIKGNGTIEPNDYLFKWGAYYADSLDGIFTWKNAHAIALGGNIDLTGAWTFEGNNKINGNGAILDLTHGGTITIGANTTLIIADTHVKGIGQNSFVFTNSTSKLEISNTTLELREDVTFTTGRLFVPGSSQFILKTYDLSFTQNSVLSVDGTILSFAVSDFPAFSTTDIANNLVPGQLKAPNSVYLEGSWNTDNVAFNKAAGNLEITSGGAIRQVGMSTGLGDSYVTQLLTGSARLLLAKGLTEDVNMDESILMGPDDQIVVLQDVTIDGRGGSITFSRPDHSQLKIAAGKTVTLENIDLLRVNAQTFDFGEGSKLIIKGKVHMSLDEDLLWQTGVICLAGYKDVFTVRGNGGERRLTFKELGVSTLPAHLQTKPAPFVELKTNTMLLQNIILNGLQYFTYESEDTSQGKLVGAIGFGGDSTIEIDRWTDMNFVVEGVNNHLHLLKNKLTLTGSITYGDLMSNVLHINMVIPYRIIGWPVVSFDNNLIDLSSPVHAALLFDDDEVIINNKGPESLVIGENGFFSGKKVDVRTHPIIQAVSDVKFGSDLDLISDEAHGALAIEQSLLAGMIKSIDLSGANRSKRVTALGMRNAEKREQLVHEQEEAEWAALGRITDQEHQDTYNTERTDKELSLPDYPDKNSTNNSETNLPSRPQRRVRRRPRMRGLFDPVSGEQYSLDSLEQGDTEKSDLYSTIGDEQMRLIDIPDPDIETIITFMHALNLPKLAGNIRLTGAGHLFTQFMIDESKSLNLALTDGARVIQGTGAITVKENDIINILGDNSEDTNRIELSGSCLYSGKLLFDHDAILEFVLTDSPERPQIRFTKESKIDLGTNGKLIFTGDGDIMFDDDLILDLGSTGGELVFTNGATLCLSGEQYALLGGIGTLEVSHGGKICLTENSRLVCGSKTTDQITLRVHTSGLIQVGNIYTSGTETDRAYLSFAGSSGSLDFSHVGSLIIGDGGRVEINGNKGAVSNGYIRSCNFGSGGQIYIAKGGELSLAENKKEVGLFDDVPGVAIDWTNTGGRIGGGGEVRFVPSQLSGQMQERFFADKAAQPNSIVATLLQTEPSFVHNTLFINSDGQRVIYTRNNITVTLGDGDNILGENSDGDLFGINLNTGERFTYSADGVRQ